MAVLALQAYVEAIKAGMAAAAAAPRAAAAAAARLLQACCCIPRQAPPQQLLLLAAAAVAVAGLAGMALLHRARYRAFYSAPSPRVRPPWWLLGHVEVSERVADRHQLYTQWHEALGPFVRIRIAHRTMLLVSDPAAAAAILTKGPSYVPRKPPEYTAFDVAHGLQGFNGMLTHQEEETWRAARKAITPAFTLSEIKRRYPTMLACLFEAVAHMDGQLAAGAAELDVEHEVLVATNRIISRAFLELPDELIDPEVLARDVAFIMGTASRFVCEPWRWLGHLYLPWLTQEGRELRRARRRLAASAEAVYDLLHARWPPVRWPSGPPDEERSLAACLMRMVDRNGRKPARGAVVAEICDSLTASETIPSTVMWTLYCVATRPQLQQQLQDELAAAGIVAAAAGTEHVQQQQQQQQQQWQQRLAQLECVFSSGGAELLKGLPLMTACLYEAMRLYPAGAPGAPRLTQVPTRVGPYLVPPGVIVLPSLYAIMNVSANWPQPQHFQPERWADADAAQRDPASGAQRWVPFSLGPKACAGQNLALLACKAAVALLLAAYEWRLSPSMGGETGVAARTYLGVTIKVDGGLWLCATPRV